ncbi:MAG TPA: GNAT family N-acetyltransferase [Acidimicrobiia bacterium]|nr:GNAT family N-acetyltransferase [Acidimicrobiia bacterium]
MNTNAPESVTALLPDGSRVRLRPVTPEDRQLIEQGFAQLSPRARYHRFLAPADHLSPRQLAYLSEVDHHDHVAWGVIDGDDAVAVGRWVRFAADPTAADVALTVLDSHQRRGIGRLLIGVLAVSARARGVGTLHFDVLAENTAMNGLLRSLRAERRSEDEVVHHVLDVTGVSPPRIVDGDLVQVLERARRDYASGSSSRLSEFTQ